MKLQPVVRKGVAQEIVEQLREQILSGGIAPGASLPAERRLAEAFGVNRLTVRQAIARLEALGLVQAHHGSGTRVLDFRRSADVGLLTDLMTVRRGDRALSTRVLRDLLEVRRVIAIEVVALVAARAGEQDLRDLRALAQEQAARTGDRPAFVRGDLEFTRRMVQACGNLAMELLFNTVARFVGVHEDVAAAMYAEPEQVALQYPGVIQLVEARQGDLARTLVRSTLESLDAQTLARFDALRKGESGS